MSEQLGAMLVRLRQRKGYTQLGVAEALCAASGAITVTRNEVSRWERQERIPSVVWLRWLAVVLEVPVAELAGAAAVTRKETGAGAPAGRCRASAAATTSWVDRSKMPRPPRTTVQETTAAVNAPRACGKGRDALSRVTIEFEHRTTSVRLSATYDDPRRALAAIGVFRAMVGVGSGELSGAQTDEAQAEDCSAGAGAARPNVQRRAAQAHVVPLRRPWRSYGPRRR